MTRLTYYKATRPDGTDFKTGTVDYAAALASGDTLTHPEKSVKDAPGTYFSVSVEPGETLIGGAWPCRLFRVEPVGRTLTSSKHPHKRAVHAMRVVEELPPHLALGPNGAQVAALIDAASRITPEQADRLHAARYAARYADWVAARVAAWDAARYADWVAAWVAAWDAARYADWVAAWDAARAAARVAARDAAWDAALALVVRDVLAPEHFATLTGPWVSVMGPLDA